MSSITLSEFEKVSPEFLRSIMPKEDLNNKNAAQEFYVRIKKKAQDKAKNGKSKSRYTLSEFETGLASFDRQKVLQILQKKFESEGFLILNVDEDSIQISWSTSDEEVEYDEEYPDYMNEILNGYEEQNYYQQQWYAQQYPLQMPPMQMQTPIQMQSPHQIQKPAQMQSPQQIQKPVQMKEMDKN